MKKPIYKIGDVSSEVGISNQTVRELEKKGLIHPSRTISGYRLYTDQDIQEIKKYFERKKGRGWISNWGHE